MKRIATTLLVAGLLATPMFALSSPAQARVSIGIGISVGIPPPALPVYAQPIIPGPGYIWTPGYWAWDPGYGGYYWVPGTWVLPPAIGMLWTPGWWGWSGGFYRWNAGYWGTHVGFYGGVNYGFGYFGTGYGGGYWRGGNFFYNRAVNNVNITNIRNVYVNKTVINNGNRVSYNGGRGGITAQPTAEQRGWANQRRYQPTAMQTRQRDTAMRNPAQRFGASQAKPAVFATQRAGRFEGQHVVRSNTPANNRMMTTESSQRRADMTAPRTAHGSMQAPQRADGFVHAPRNRNASPNRQTREMQARPSEQMSRRPETAQQESMRRGGNPGGWTQQRERPQPQSREWSPNREAAQQHAPARNNGERRGDSRDDGHKRDGGHR